MYEYPELTDIGDAREVVLGIASFGMDLDGTWVSDGGPYPPYPPYPPYDGAKD